jgi:exonuclease SbcD
VRIAHLADLHLGFRQYHRLTQGGINQREADVANAFRAAVDGVIAARPDVVLLAGDVFHAVRPTNAAIVFAFRELQRLQNALPGVRIVLIAGNHDTPRSTETGSILRLYQELGVDVALDEARRFSYPDLDLAILAVPHAAMAGPPEERPPLRPAGKEKWQVLLAHGEIPGIIPGDRSVLEYGGALLDLLELRRESWSYVALGHYHVQKELAPNIWYAGALEYASTNLWWERAAEAVEGIAGKGWLLADLERGTVARHPVAAARPVEDLPHVNARDMRAADLDAAIAARLDLVPGGLDDAIVRLVVVNAPRHLVRDLDHTAIREAKARALHLHLDFRRPESTFEEGSGAPGRRPSLTEQVRGFLTGRPLPERVDRERFVNLGLELMADHEDPEAGAAA